MIYERQDSQIPITVPFKQLVKVFPAQPCGKDEMSGKKTKTRAHICRCLAAEKVKRKRPPASNPAKFNQRRLDTAIP